MAKLPMNEDLPFDEATTPPLVSTGDLPLHAEIRQLVTDAYERYRGDDSGTVADYIPVLAQAWPDLFGIAVVGPWASQSRSGTSPRRSRSRASRSRSCSPTSATRSATRPPASASGSTARASRSTRSWPSSSNAERTMNPLVNAGAIATTSLAPGATLEEKWTSIRERLSRFAGRGAHRQRGGLRLRVGDQHAQPGHRPPPQGQRRLLLRPRRGDRHLHPPVLAGRDGPRPRGDGGHAGERRCQPGHRRDGDQARGVPAGAGRDGERRNVRASPGTGSTRSGSRARAASAAAS